MIFPAPSDIIGESFDIANQFFGGGLKFGKKERIYVLAMIIVNSFFTIIVRWDYSAKNRQELTVRRGDEVEIVKQAGKFWKVKSQISRHVYCLHYWYAGPRNKLPLLAKSENALWSTLCT